MTVSVPDEIVPLVEMLKEIHQRDGKLWNVTAEAIRAMMAILNGPAADLRRRPYVVLKNESIDILPLATRTHHALTDPVDPHRDKPIRTVADLMRYSIPDLRVRNCGEERGSHERP